MAKELFAEERQNQIVQLVNQKHKLLVPELCDYFEVSPATIRNDLNDLESRGLLKRTHGGAISNTKTGFEPNTLQKQVKNSGKKVAIATAAAELVEDGDTIAVDTGTTMFAFAFNLLVKKHLTVVTNDFKIAALLEEKSDATVIFTGGLVRKGFHCTVGPLAVAALSTLRVDKTFLATNGLTLENGISTPDIGQAEIKQSLIRMGTQKILLCDSTKIGADSFAMVAGLDKIDILVTDQGIDKETLAALEDKEIKVKVAE